MKNTTAIAAILALGLLAGAGTAEAGNVSKEVPFALDEWYELEVTDGPVSLHQLRIETHSAGLTKSKIFRPGNDEYLQTVQIELEYSNESSKDWEAHLRIAWLDEEGRVIDGYNDTEDLDDEERHDETTVTISTLKYGLDRAVTLRIDIDFYPD